MRERVIIAGFGGQGIITAGKVLITAGMNSGKFVSFFPSYGTEIRGGYSECSVVISDSEIGSPIFEKSDSLIAMNELSLKVFFPRLKQNGSLFINSSLIKTKPNWSNAMLIPATEIAEKIGKDTTATLVMIGFYIKVKKLFSKEVMLKAIENFFKNKKTIEANKTALLRGFNHPP